MRSDQNEITQAARDNGWTLAFRGGYHLWSKGGRQVMLAYGKKSGAITAAYINSLRVTTWRKAAIMRELRSDD